MEGPSKQGARAACRQHAHASGSEVNKAVQARFRIQRFVKDLRGLASQQTWRMPRLRLTHLLALVICVSVGAWLNPSRAAFVSVPVPVYRGFHVPEEQYDGATVRWARQYAKVEFVGMSWRPARVDVSLTTHPSVTAQEITALISVDDREARRVSVRRGWQQVDLVANGPRSSDLVLRLTTLAPPGQERAVGLGEIRVTPLIDRAQALLHGIAGAAAGLVAWLFIMLRHNPPPAVALAGHATPGSRPGEGCVPLSRRGAALLFAGIVVYLAFWMVLKPVLQSPDEPQHLLRANSVLKQGWRDPPAELKLDPRFANAVVLQPTSALMGLFFDRTHQLDAAQIDELKQVSRTIPHMPAFVRTPLTTYPAGYYGTVFALAEAVSAPVHATPYQSIYLYRTWTVLLAAGLWVLVYRALRQLPDTAERSGAILALLLLNPTLAFVTSSVTPDSVNNPLAALGILLTYRVAVTGKHPWPATIALVACAWTKPSALLVFGAIAGSSVLVWRVNRLPVSHLGAVALAVGRAIVISVFGFYAWSPPRFVAGPPITLTLNGYLDVFWDRLPDVWVSYWGKLGWLDYAAPAGWYQLLAVLVVLNIVFASRHGVPGFARFGAVVFGLYLVLMMVGEFRLLRVAGYNFQGRHLFPAMIGMCALTQHPKRWAWVALLVGVGALNVALMHESVMRYYAGDWLLVWRSLP